MPAEVEADGTMHLVVGGYDWWWRPGERAVCDGDGGGVVLLVRRAVRDVVLGRGGEARRRLDWDRAGGEAVEAGGFCR